MWHGRLLTGGVDLWLNNPIRPLEASGTSGMKAVLQGVPNLSILDGWLKAAETTNGFAFGSTSHRRDDQGDAALQLPDRACGADLGRRQSIAMQKAAIATAADYTTERMVSEYKRGTISRQSERIEAG